MKHSHLLETVEAGAFDGDDIRIDDGVSEALHLRALGRGADWVATGCSYDYVDPDSAFGALKLCCAICRGGGTCCGCERNALRGKRSCGSRCPSGPI